MPNDITPALTPLEWAEYEVQPFTDGDFAFGKPPGHPLGRRHALAALAMHGQPYGFTHADAELARALCNGWPPDSPEFHRIDTLRQKIAALLPISPETPHA